ncbi:RNA-binding protein, putative [Leishmania donovani]|uniref:RNA-binding protein, putative n=1 Tax=Leishmania donovani TaxID=5661 RepID=A0A3S7WNY0_LEIDO|nr:RNA-binding protein, putative [Leishmania donovani]
MYGQQFVPGQMYGQPNMMPYQPGVLSPPMSTGVSVMPNYAPPYQNGMPPGSVQQQQGQGPAQGQAMPQTQPRSRNNEVGNTSSVIHMRNVTPEVTQLSIQNLAQNFGDIKHIVMLRQMNQALIEMKSPKSAEQLVDFFKEPGYAEIDGRRVYIRFSTHQNLTATQHATRTLLVSMFNTQYDVSAAAHITPEIVYQIFASYGTVERIVVLPKNESSQWNHNRVQALVQFDARESAEHVKNILQGQPVTLGETITFTLDIQFSRMDEIKTTNPTTSLVVDDEGAHRPAGTMDPMAMNAAAMTTTGMYPPMGWS